jgi:hypothetical protein
MDRIAHEAAAAGEPAAHRERGSGAEARNKAEITALCVNNPHPAPPGQAVFCVLSNRLRMASGVQPIPCILLSVAGPVPTWKCLSNRTKEE